MRVCLDELKHEMELPHIPDEHLLFSLMNADIAFDRLATCYLQLADGRLEKKQVYDEYNALSIFSPCGRVHTDDYGCMPRNARARAKNVTCPACLKWLEENSAD